MPSSAVDTVLKGTITATGTLTSVSGNVEYVSWDNVVTRMTDKRPASISNPVRKDGTRNQGSWSHSASLTLFGDGRVTGRNSPSAKTLNLSGQVTMGRADLVLPDHAEARRRLNDARMKALSGMSESKSQFNVAAYEARGTIRSLAQYCEKAERGVRRLWRTIPETLRGKYNGAPPYQWKDVPGDYLGYLYGLKPIADDIGNGLDQLSGLSKRGMAFGYTVSSGSSGSSRFTEQVRTPRFVYPFEGIGARRSFARVGYTYNFPDWWIQSSPIVTPFSDAWELTRMSFVLDWVLPVGNWIGAMEAAQFDPYFRSGFEVYGTEEVATGPFTNPSAGKNGNTLSMQNDGFRARRFAMSRVGLGPEDNPSHRVRFPSFRNFLGIDHAAQALSLLSQTMKTPPSRW